jgi:hypothetical protein
MGHHLPNREIRDGGAMNDGYCRREWHHKFKATPEVEVQVRCELCPERPGDNCRRDCGAERAKQDEPGIKVTYIENGTTS